MSHSDCVDHGRKGFGLGYATAWLNGSTTTLHRKVYFEATGELPEVVRHSCDNPRCINRAHLVGGTQVDNMADMRERGRSGDRRNFGEQNGRTIISAADVARIRDEYVPYSRDSGTVALARKYGCGTSQIHRIVRKKQRTSQSTTHGT